MALPYLPKAESQTHSAAAANNRDDEGDEGEGEGEGEDEDDKAETSALEATRKAGKLAATRPDAEPKDYEGQPNPFLLTQREKQLARDRALAQKEDVKREPLANKTKRGEGVVDDDMPNQDEWDDMGDEKAW